MGASLTSALLQSRDWHVTAFLYHVDARLRSRARMTRTTRELLEFCQMYLESLQAVRPTHVRHFRFLHCVLSCVCYVGFVFIYNGLRSFC